MKKKDLTMPLLVILICLAVAEVAYMIYWVYSPVQGPIEVTDFTLTLSVNPNGRNVTFSGLLSHPTASVSGKTIYVYHCDSTGLLSGANQTEIATATTTGVGTYNTNYLEPNNGTYYYKAGYGVS